MAEKPLVTRGVLLDWYSYALRKGLPHRPFTNQGIPLDELLEVAREQGVTFRRGDVLVIRTGWTAAYSKLTDAEKENLGGRDDRASCGVEATEAAIRWHWESGFAAVASDTVAYEAWPSPLSWGVCMHEVGDSFLRFSKPAHLPMCTGLPKWVGYAHWRVLGLGGVESSLQAAESLDVHAHQPAAQSPWRSSQSPQCYSRVLVYQLNQREGCCDMWPRYSNHSLHSRTLPSFRLPIWSKKSPFAEISRSPGSFPRHFTFSPIT
jgi:hypothetical protein